MADMYGNDISKQEKDLGKYAGELVKKQDSLKFLNSVIGEL